jgi:GNAT superfamily N-acetyltransferase
MTEMIGMLFSLEPDFPIDAAKQRRGLEALLSLPLSAAFVATEDDGSIIGMVTAQLTASTAEGGLSAWMEDLYVLKGHRKQGVAKALLSAVEAWCLANGAHRVQLLADRDNKGALEFYAKAGYGETHMVVRRRRF